MLATGLARYQVDTKDWATARGQKASFVVALVHDDWGMDVSYDHPGETSDWVLRLLQGLYDDADQ